MADSPKQSPLGANFTSSLLKNEGLGINPVNLEYLGRSRYNSDYDPGKLINDTCLKWITYGINAAYQNGAVRDARIPITSVTPAAGPPYTKYVIAKLGDTNWNRVAGTTGIDYEEGNLIEVQNAGIGTGFVFLNGEKSKISVYNYDNLLAVGASRLPALSNGLPPTYLINDPSDLWQGQATTGYAIAGDGSDIEIDRFAGQGQSATWFPYNSSNPNVSVTQWGFLRCLTLQAWNAFNWNGITPADEVEYKSYVTSFTTIEAFLKFNNENMLTLRNSLNFMEGVFSNMNDLMSGDITGVSLSTQAFGQDLINLGKVIDLSKISTFGLPSNLLQTLQKNNALTQPLILTLLVSGLSQTEINDIAADSITPTKDQQQKIYSAYLLISGKDLEEILKILGCKTKGFVNLSDLLSVKRLFPISFTSLTVPIYNTNPGPTNSKTYYLLFVDREMNPQLVEPKIKEIIGVITPPVEPPIEIPPPPPIVVEEVIQEIITPPVPILPIVPQPVVIIPPPPPEPSVPAPEPPREVPLPFVTGRDPAPGRQGGGGCVALESFIPLVETEQKHNGREITKAWMLESGMKISLGTDSLEIVDGSVVKTLNDHQPCVRIVTSDGITLVCSTTAPILTKDKGFIPATEVYGKRVAVMRNGKTWYDEVVGLEDVGMKFVRVIDAGNNSFWAGERPGSFILHHNVPINDKYNYDKK